VVVGARVLAGRLPSDEHRADVRAAFEIATDTRDCELFPNPMSASSVCMFSNPMLTGPARPDSRAPAMMGISSPSGDANAAAENTSASLGLPTAKRPAFSRKNGRFSRKEQVEAVQIDLLLVDFDLSEIGMMVPSSVRLGVTLYFASSPTSPKNFVSPLTERAAAPHRACTE
jgi:hypothetical protein